MTSEYVKLSRPEKLLGEKNLLYAEMETLTSIKKLLEYKKLRKQELIYTIRLKSKIKAFVDTMRSLDRILPKTAIQTPKTTMKRLNQKDVKEENLEQELEKIRQKLERIQAN